MDGRRLGRIRAGRPDPGDLRFGAADLDDRDLVVDAVAGGASSGSTVCLEALLGLIDDHHLDRPSIRRLIIDDTDADDVHQDVLIAVSRSIAAFRGDSSFSTWLYTVARNTAASHLRRRRDTQALVDDDSYVSDAQRVSSMIATRGSLEAAVAALPEHFRRAVVMRDIEQRSYDEIAEALGLPLNTVKSRLSRGRALAARHLVDAGFLGDAGAADG